MPQESFLTEKQEIEKQIQKLQRKMRTLHSRQRRPVINSIVRSMQEYEITPEEIAQAFERRQKRAITASKAPARYRNPQTGDTWTGRGRPPRWITDAEQNGQSREQFLIKD
ncbi:H-NS histone family protein [Paenalcaligenes hermetiae]|uniref:H-NS histone family protein n=1 Tax=Paenalcaligenes hermetiae TaxID=1157987 RepID=A0ABP9LZU2_9BURK